MAVDDNGFTGSEAMLDQRLAVRLAAIRTGRVSTVESCLTTKA
jgi:hypothetical protein